ncbi:thaumatin family-domain-containing protein [Boletus reticuloceps]|uniref:Thaumatin family-domain-containing protein n=1 Tax=Boletus reticuloceps TaxID=495285 RepID=A0A8I3ABM3_9AGAM|nr:thaumatin family-domain-containing protein [Boletus reticuloceps]
MGSCSIHLRDLPSTIQNSLFSPSHSDIFQVPSDWTAGRIWGRRDCDFSTNPGPNSCLDGGCNGGLQCDPNGGTGVPPASLAEFTLNSGGTDYYDVSLVDGYNLPLSITNTVGCGIANCPVDLGPNCPAPLIGPFDSTGFPVGCKSACEANLDGNPANSPNCCSGQYNTPATCPSSGVAYYSYFKWYGNREQLPELLLLRLRRIKRHRALDLPRQP